VSARGTGTVRVVVSKIGLDGHDRGAKVIARALRDAGMEVIYAGLRRRSDELAEMVLQEDVDVLGLSILSGAVVPLVASTMEALHARGLDHVVVIVGGIIPPAVKTELARLGVEGAFGPGTPLSDVIAYVYREVDVRRRG
jgi:methylmalonyl-CoA mutase, C-terminal domain